MSHDASIDFHVGMGYSALRALGALLESGWSANDHGSIAFLPLHDQDQFDWRRKSLTDWASVELELKEKVHAGELVGVVLTWSDTGRGGEVLMFPDRISFSLSSERLKLDGSAFTDFGWYVTRIEPALAQAGIEVPMIVCTDHR